MYDFNLYQVDGTIIHILSGTVPYFSSPQLASDWLVLAAVDGHVTSYSGLSGSEQVLDSIPYHHAILTDSD